MILLTGSSGFLGKNLIKKLKKEKIKFIGIDSNKPSSQSKNCFKKDINDENLKKFIKKNSTVIHLASVSNVKDCQDNPMETLKSNINGTINIINQSIKSGAKHFIFASTEWVYPNKNNIFKENFNINIDDLDNNYSISKLLGERILLNFSKEIKITILRLGIIYSNRKVGGAAVENLVNSIKKMKSIKIGSKLTSRRFVHIDDIVDGFYTSYKKKISGIFNLGGDSDVTLEEIVNISSKKLKKKIKVYENSNSKPSKRKVSNFKAKKIMGWSPKINIETGINKIIFDR